MLYKVAQLETANDDVEAENWVAEPGFVTPHARLLSNTDTLTDKKKNENVKKNKKIQNTKKNVQI